MRLELLTPEGDMFTSDTYNKLFTLHGIVMIFFFLIPAIPAVHRATSSCRSCSGPKTSPSRSSTC